jgi:hypothetical protein
VVWYAFRDPGDIIVSQMGLRDIGFDQALRMAGAAMVQLQNALQTPAIHLIPYRDIIDSPQACVFQMARSFGFILNVRERAAILESCTFEAKSAEVDRIRRGEGEVTEAVTGTRRIRSNPHTLVTDRHIQSGKLGRWRGELTPDQQAIVERQFAQFYRMFDGF